MTTSPLPLLVEADQLATALTQPQNNLLVIDVSSRASYDQHHLPGAIHVEPKALQCGVAPAPGKLPGIEQLTELFSRIGLESDHQVIAYDDEGGGWAGRLIWTLDVLGHTNYAYLNGGIQAWLAQNHPIETKNNPGTARPFTVTINKAPMAEIDDIVPNLGEDNFAIWDARSPAEFDGSKVLAQRGGHIPGAVNIDWLELIDRSNHMRLVDLNTLQQRLNALGLTQDKTIVTHCQTHHRSGLTYLAMKILGYPNIKGYHGSWSEWGNREDTPIT